MSSRRRSSDALFLAQSLVVEAGRDRGDQFGDRALVHVRVLPEIDRREMKAEQVDGALKGAQAPARHDGGVGLLERTRDDREIGAELGGGSVRRPVDDRLAQRDDMVELARRLGEARVHARDGAPVGLLAPGGGGIVGRVRKPGKLRTHRGEVGCERKFGAKLVQFVEVVADRPGALQPHRLVEDVRGHERIAVPVAADPGSDPKERADRLRAGFAGNGVKPVFDRAIEAGQLMEERVVVERERVRHLVDDLEFRLPQHIGAPQDQNRAPQAFFVQRELSLVADEPLALVQQFSDLKFARERALAPHFRRVGGKHRAHQRAIEEVGERRRLDAHLARALKRIGERSRTRRGAGHRMGAIAADVMLILRDVGEVREVAVCAHDRERLVGAETVQSRLELAPRADFVVAMEPDRGLPDLLDQLEGLFPLLLAHRVAEDSAKQADVFA